MVDFPLTFVCNNNCRSCISIPTAISRKGHIPFHEVIKYIKTSAMSGDYIGISGGEPTLSPIFFKVLNYIKELFPDTFTFVVSNGRMFYYPSFVDKLCASAPPDFRIGIALYGDRPGVHDYITRVPGSFKQTWQGIRNLADAGIRVETRVIISRVNYKTLPKIAERIVCENDGIERFVLINMKYTGNAWLNRDLLFVKESEVVPHALKAVDILDNAGIDVHLFHFPPCLLPEEYRKFAAGITKPDEHEFTLLPQCNECALKEKCPRIWVTYLTAGGDPKEFKPVKDL